MIFGIHKIIKKTKHVKLDEIDYDIAGEDVFSEIVKK